MKLLISSVLIILMTAGTAVAQPYSAISPAASSVSFRYTQMGVTMDGRFKRFSAALEVDPRKPTEAKAKVTIDLASIDTGAAESDAEVAGKSWFNIATYPTAIFELDALKPTAAGRYDASGKLTLKGRTKSLVIPVTLSPNGVLTGSVVIRRADFGIGEGMWSKFDVVANEVTVSFRLTLK